MRSIQIGLASFTSYDVCLCAKHRNFALKLQGLNSTGAKIRDTVAHQSQEDNTSCLELIISDSII